MDGVLMKKIIFTLILLIVPVHAFAQAGYNPEFLGNAAAAPRPGFSPKIFLSYYNQHGISANDVEIAFEPQYWIRGFTGEKKKDYIQFLAHLPIGYRAQDVAGTHSSVAGIGSLSANIEHFLKVIDDGDTVMWFDNGLSAGFPTATMHDGVRIGTNAYSIGWFQENFISYKKWIFSISPIALTWTFRDTKTNVKPGLSMNIMNSAYGYQITEGVALGVTFAYLLGNLAGADDGLGGNLSTSHRFYAGPAASISLCKDTSLQITGIIDAYTKNADRGQGLFTAFWHMF